MDGYTDRTVAERDISPRINLKHYSLPAHIKTHTQEEKEASKQANNSINNIGFLPLIEQISIMYFLNCSKSFEFF